MFNSRSCLERKSCRVVLVCTGNWLKLSVTVEKKNESMRLHRNEEKNERNVPFLGRGGGLESSSLLSIFIMTL